MYALRERVREIAALARRPPTPDRRAAVLAALEDKWEGVQSAAVKVLGAWGDAESCHLLRTFLVEAFDRPYGWSIRGVTLKALEPHITQADVDWVLDLYLGLTRAVRKHEVLRLVVALPPEAARNRLVETLSDTDPINRQAAVKAIGNMLYQDRDELIGPLRDDPDEFVRRSAQLLTGST